MSPLVEGVPAELVKEGYPADLREVYLGPGPELDVGVAIASDYGAGSSPAGGTAGGGSTSPTSVSFLVACHKFEDGFFRVTEFVIRFYLYLVFGVFCKIVDVTGIGCIGSVVN